MFIDYIYIVYVRNILGLDSFHSKGILEPYAARNWRLTLEVLQGFAILERKTEVVHSMFLCGMKLGGQERTRGSALLCAINWAWQLDSGACSAFIWPQN